jgi:hypothetical protein
MAEASRQRRRVSVEQLIQAIPVHPGCVSVEASRVCFQDVAGSPSIFPASWPRSTIAIILAYSILTYKAGGVSVVLVSIRYEIKIFPSEAQARKFHWQRAKTFSLVHSFGSITFLDSRQHY